MTVENYAFLDLEASALVDGFPVSVAVAQTDGALFHALVLPAAEWLDSCRWDPAAENLHRHTLEHLRRHGRGAAEILADMNDRLAGRVLVSDSPEYDFRWLSLLVEAAGGACSFAVSRMDADALLCAVEDAAGLDAAVRREIERNREAMHVHNALYDAASWAAAVDAVRSGAAAVPEIFEAWKRRVAGHLANGGALPGRSAPSP